MPSEDLEFSCSKENGCTLTTHLTGYDTTNLTSLDFKGTKPTKGTVTISDNGKKVSATNLDINGFTCNYEDGKASCSQGGTEPTYYYAFGTPTTSSTTDYTTLGKNFFARLGEDNSTGVCIIDGEKLLCINANDYDNSVKTLKDHFEESSCHDRGSDVYCRSADFSCSADSSGPVRCNDATGGGCAADGHGTFDCYL